MSGPKVIALSGFQCIYKALRIWHNKFCKKKHSCFFEETPCDVIDCVIEFLGCAVEKKTWKDSDLVKDLDLDGDDNSGSTLEVPALKMTL